MFVFFDSVCLCVCIEIKWKWSAWICEGFVNHIAQFCLRNVLILSHNMELVTRVSSELREDQLYFIYVCIYIYIYMSHHFLLCLHSVNMTPYEGDQSIKADTIEAWRKQWHPTPVLLPGNPMDGGAWWAAVHRVAKSRTPLSNFTFTFHFHALEKEMATHSSVLA